MQPTALRADFFGHRSGECDDIMSNLSLDLIDPLEFEITPRCDGLRGIFGHNSGFSKCQAGGGFHLQPAPKLVFITPDSAHFRACVAGYQGNSSKWMSINREPVMINAVTPHLPIWLCRYAALHH